MKHIYALVEKSTEKKETPDAEYVASSRALNQAELLILEDCMKDAKQHARENAEFYEYVNDGVDRFHERTGRHLTLIDNPVSAQISF